MSERFVEAFLVAPSKLTALLGTPAVGFAAIEKALGKKQVFEDLLMTVGDGDDEDGLTDVEEGFAQLAAGKNPTITYSERLTQLVLHAHAEPLRPAMMECNFMPADEDGLWRPAFKALGMKTIAKQWGRSTLMFPSRKAVKNGFGWPVMTLVEPASVALWKAELATPWRKKLKTLPNTTFDPDADDAEEDVYGEVAAGLATLEKWVTAASKPTASKRKAVARTGNALVLILDGDQ